MKRLVLFLGPLVALLQAQSPTFPASGVVNNASNVAGPISPGELMTIYGSNLAASGALTSCYPSGGVLQTVCSAASVLLDDKPAPLVYASASQLVFQAPFDLGGSNVRLQVRRESGAQTLQSAVVNVTVAPTSPGLYTSGVFGAFLGPSSAPITAANPAKPGDMIVAFGTGFGVTDPPTETGKLPAGIPRIAAPVTMKVGAVDATVMGAFLLPNTFPPFAQVNFTVPANVQNGNVPVVVTVGGVSSPAVTLPVGFPKPAITGVSNAASGAAAIAAGSWVSIYGTNLAQTSREWRSSDFSGVNLPTALDGVSVKINGKPAFVNYINPQQINVQAPTDSANGTVQVEVTNAGGVATASANLQTYSPAFFTFRNKYPAAVHLDRAYVAPAGYFGSAVTSRPAKPGDIVQIYATGFGSTNPSVAAGQMFSNAAPLADPAQLRITVAGIAATVQFAGLVIPGQYQFNVVVPDVPDGEHPIAAAIAGVNAQTGLVLPVQR